ncbi:MAG: hypothetical protein IH948_09655 [Bacteroidetes bacterium]|nr:hypothetical protein [Bacteroidota bacterium]
MYKVVKTKLEITKLAEKLIWKDKETRLAIRELKKAGSRVDCKKLLKICIDTNIPDERLFNLTEYIHQSLEEDTVDIICDFLASPDPCFNVLTLFNFADIKSSDELRSLFYRYDKKSNEYIELKKTFLRDDLHLDLFPGYFKYKTLRGDWRIDTYRLCYESLDMFINMKGLDNKVDIELLLLDVVERVGFVAFEIEAFRNLAALYSYFPIGNNKAETIASIISYPSSKIKVTQRKYWLIYVLVEKFKEKFGVRGSYREVAKMLSSLSSKLTSQ